MVRYTANMNTSSDTYYSPGDSRLIELNTIFCDRIKLSESSPRTDAELNLLTKNEIPPITDRSNLRLTVISLFKGISISSGSTTCIPTLTLAYQPALVLEAV